MGAAIATFASSVAGAAAGVLLLSACGSCSSTVHRAVLPEIAAGRIDGVEIDQAGRKLFFADQAGAGVDVLDVSGAPRFAGTVATPAPANGLAFAPNLNRLYAGLNGGAVAVIDTDGTSPTYMKVIATVDADPKVADLLDYSPATKSLYVGTGPSSAVVVIDAITNTVTHRFDVKAPVEQPRFDSADGRIYVTTPSTDSILQLDASSGKVTRTYAQASCQPRGMAINPSRQLAVVTCRGSTAAFNLKTGSDEVSQNVQGGDIVNYDSRVDMFSIGSSHGPRDSTVGVLSGDGRFMAQVPSSPNAHGAVFDGRTGAVYAASAVGLLTFTPAACAPPPDWLTFTWGLAFYIVPLAGMGLFLVLYARRRSSIDPNAPKRPSREDLHREDLAAERERIRALEDAIYGPDGG